MRPLVGLLQVVHVVGDDERQAELARDRLQADVDDLLLLDALVLHLEEELSGAEDVAEGGGGLERPPVLPAPQARRHLALEAAAQADEPLGVPGQQVLVDPRLVVEALGEPRRDELDQVVEALVGLGQQHQVVVRLARRARALVPAARRDVHLAAQNRLDAALLRLVVERDRREHVPVLGDRERGHLQLLRAVEQLLDAARAVEQRELRVEVQVDELGHHVSTCGLSALCLVRAKSWCQVRCTSQRTSVTPTRHRARGTALSTQHQAPGTLLHSHSIVAGGFELMSYTTRLTPLTSFMMRDEITASRSCGRRAQSAVMPSRLSTARSAIVYS